MTCGDAKGVNDLKPARAFAILLLMLGIVVWWFEDGGRLMREALGARFPYQPLALLVCLLLLALRSIQGALLLIASFIGRKRSVKKLIVAASVAGFLSAVFWMNTRYWGIDLLWGLLLASDACLIVMATGCFEMVRKHAGLAKKAGVAPCVVSLVLALHVGWGISIETLIAALGFAALWEADLFLIAGCEEEIGRSSASSDSHVLKGAGMNNETAFKQIKELKFLLDEGALTQEEYDLRKRELLGISDAIATENSAEGLTSGEKDTSCQQSDGSVSETGISGDCSNNDCEQKGENEGQSSVCISLSPMQDDNHGDETAVKDGRSETELLKEYKELLDSGVISQGEFNRKKAEILGFESDEQRADREALEAKRAANRHRAFKTTIVTLGVLLIAGAFVFITTAKSLGLAIIVAGFLIVALVSYLILDSRKK